MTSNIKFREVQYLGRNMYGLSRRLIMAIFCYIAHFYSEEKGNIEGIFFLVGSIITLVSFVLLFIPYYTIELKEDVLLLKSLQKKEVSIPLNVIRKADVCVYNRYHLNNPVFNVFNEKEFRFYAEGRKALLLNLEGGNILKIGVKKADLLYSEIKKSIS